MMCYLLIKVRRGQASEINIFKRHVFNFLISFFLFACFFFTYLSFLILCIYFSFNLFENHIL